MVFIYFSSHLNYDSNINPVKPITINIKISLSLFICFNLIFSEEQSRLFTNLKGKLIHKFIFLSNSYLPLLNLLLFLFEPLVSPIKLNIVFAFLLFKSHNFLSFCKLLCDEHFLKKVKIFFVNIAAHWFHILDFLNIFFNFLSLFF